MGESSIPFFMDNCVADSAGKLLEKAGHDVAFLRDYMPSNTKDPIIAMTCAMNARVLVSHDKDFKEISKTFALSKRKTGQLHRVSLRCSEPNAAGRLQEALSVIEAEWARMQQSGGQMLVEITEVAIRIVR